MKHILLLIFYRKALSLEAAHNVFDKATPPYPLSPNAEERTVNIVFLSTYWRVYCHAITKSRLVFYCDEGNGGKHD